MNILQTMKKMVHNLHKLQIATCPTITMTRFRFVGKCILIQLVANCHQTRQTETTNLRYSIY